MRHEVPDLRMPVLAVSAWSGALLARAPGPVWPAVTATLAFAVLGLVWRHRGRRAGLTVLATLLVGGVEVDQTGDR